MLDLEILPLRLGIHSTYKGYSYLVTSLKIALINDQPLLCISKSIFPEVAYLHHTTVSNVERDLRTIIHVCWNSEGREILNSMSYYELHKPPTVSEFIDILYWFYRKNSKSSPSQLQSYQ